MAGKCSREERRSECHKRYMDIDNEVRLGLDMKVMDHISNCVRALYLNYLNMKYGASSSKWGLVQNQYPGPKINKAP